MVEVRTGCTDGHMQMQCKDVLYDPSQPRFGKLLENIPRVGNQQRMVGRISEPVEPKLWQQKDIVDVDSHESRPSAQLDSPCLSRDVRENYDVDNSLFRFHFTLP